jgi:hypothetical protein
VSAGSFYSCAIRKSGVVTCWGSLITHSATEARDPPTAHFVELSIGGGTDGYGYGCACGVETEASIACWGQCAETPVEGVFTELGVGAGHACGLDAAGSEWCWGNVFRMPL